LIFALCTFSIRYAYTVDGATCESTRVLFGMMLMRGIECGVGAGDARWALARGWCRARGVVSWRHDACSIWWTPCSGIPMPASASQSISIRHAHHSPFPQFPIP